MPTVVTFQAGRVALIVVLVALAVACSRERQDWRSAQSADTSEAWERFIEQHPDSELVVPARARIAQLTEERAWQYARNVNTVDAYREFLASHPKGRWTEEARIRIEGFSLGSVPRTALPTPEEAAAIDASARVHAFRLGTASPPESTASLGTPHAADTTARAQVAVQPDAPAMPGEAAQAAAPDVPAAAAPDVPASAAPESRGSLSPSPGTASPPLTAGYGVQLGAFGSEASADRAWQRLQGRFAPELAGLSPRIVVASTDAGQLYRLQAPAAGEAQARAICASLQERSQPCVPVVTR